MLVSSSNIKFCNRRKVILSSAVGKTNIDELKWLTETILTEVANWKDGWAYIADCSQMEPVVPAEGRELVEMTKKFVEAGCKAFAEGNSIMLKVQAHKNTERSNTGIPEAHFATTDEALVWLKETVNL